jgi:MFS family permease
MSEPAAALPMTPLERRASFSLASIFALRVLGLFLVLPVFAIDAARLPGGEDAFLVGFALGIYGLTQGCLQLPFGAASDRFGRKKVILIGLVIFALGSFIAALADSLFWLTVGRALQGAGAISAAVTASIADLTRESQRSKAMALVGGSVGLMFALSLVLAPLIYGSVGLSGLFALTGFLVLGAMAVVVWVVPPIPAPLRDPDQRKPSFREVVLEPDLLRLNFGIFSLHMVQMAMFVALPGVLVSQFGLPVAEHWKLYLPVVLASFSLMMPPLNWAERHGRVRSLFCMSVLLVAAVQFGLWAQPAGLVWMAGLLFVFFVGFNLLEAMLPSMVSRIAPAASKGTALGIYNTTQALGLAAGGMVGGALQSRGGAPLVFVACGVLLAVWMVVAITHRRWPKPGGSMAAAH